ncbi:MAG TPA: polysaccharide deacetylase family protein, partial [Tepidiformaceae bacterium]|nr:polysaccharide deacetylase family protein [Tepidiformaceae bacterium]
GGGGTPPTPTAHLPGSPTTGATATPTAPAPTPTGETPATLTPTPPSGTFSYTIVRGDTLFSLARRFGTTVEAISALNGITDPNAIEVGDVIRIPTAGTPVPTSTAVPGGASIRFEHGPRGTNKVALTFDMGGRVDPAIDIMNYLVANNVRSTIFMTGAMAENPNTDAGRRVLAIIQANPGLFELGNHSYSHPDFRDLTDSQILDELRRTETAVAKHTTATMPPLFRPPYGGLDADVLRAVGAAGYSRPVMWDVDTADWRHPDDGGPSAQAMVTKVLNNAQGGSIVIMHLGGYNTFEALPGIVEGLRSAGFELVRVGELLQ